MDRAEIDSVDEMLDTPAGKFENVLKVEETTPLEPSEKEFKFYAPGVGLIQEEVLKLVKYVLPEVQETGKLEMKSSVRSVQIAGDTIEVELNSSSTISEFKLDRENKRVCFNVEGTAGAGGRTEISIGRILEGPYTVMIDSQATNDFEVAPADASGETAISISYPGNNHNIAISGANVVPEFPLSAIGASAAIVGLVIFISRCKFIGVFMKRAS